VTPFVTPISYEAMVADVIGIRYGITIAPNKSPVLFAESETVSVQTRNKPMPDAADCITTLIRDARINMEGLAEQAHYIEGFAEHLRRITRETILPNRSLPDHVSIMGRLREARGILYQGMLQDEFRCLSGQPPSRDFLRAAVSLYDDWYVPVRLLALFGATTPKALSDVDEIRQMIIDRFGLQAMAALWSLDEAGIVCDRKKPMPWSALKAKFSLSSETPTCRADQPFQGYMPLIVRLVQKLAKNQWNDCHTILKNVGIPFNVHTNMCNEMKGILIVFVGGVMYGEIASLREQMYDSRLPMDILTTEIFSTKTFLDGLAGVR
jgi:hypothetical protein